MASSPVINDQNRAARLDALASGGTPSLAAHDAAIQATAANRRGAIDQVLGGSPTGLSMSSAEQSSLKNLVSHQMGGSANDALLGRRYAGDQLGYDVKGAAGYMNDVKSQLAEQMRQNKAKLGYDQRQFNFSTSAKQAEIDAAKANPLSLLSKEEQDNIALGLSKQLAAKEQASLELEQAQAHDASVAATQARRNDVGQGDPFLRNKQYKGNAEDQTGTTGRGPSQVRTTNAAPVANPNADKVDADYYKALAATGRAYESSGAKYDDERRMRAVADLLGIGGLEAAGRYASDEDKINDRREAAYKRENADTLRAIEEEKTTNELLASRANAQENKNKLTEGEFYDQLGAMGIPEDKESISSWAKAAGLSSGQIQNLLMAKVPVDAEGRKAERSTYDEIASWVNQSLAEQQKDGSGWGNFTKALETAYAGQPDVIRAYKARYEPLFKKISATEKAKRDAAYNLQPDEYSTS